MVKKEMIKHWIKFKNLLAKGGIIKVIPIKTFLLPPYKRGHIDCLVIGKKNYRKAEKFLESQGFKKGRRFYRDRGKRFWLFPGIEKAPPIHLHAICGWAGIGYLRPQQIWERRRVKEIDGNEIDVPSYEDEVLISALHSVFENKSIMEDEFFYLADVVNRQKLDWNYIGRVSESIGCSTALKVFWRFFQQAKEKKDVVFPFSIAYKEVLKAMLARLKYDMSYLHIGSFIEDIFSYTLDITLDILKGHRL